MINLLSHINANGANADPGLCWFLFGFQANGSGVSTTPVDLIVDGVLGTYNLGDRVGTNDNPLVEWIDCAGIYNFIYGCDMPNPPFDPCPCVGCAGPIQNSYSFDANGCCGSPCDCVPFIQYNAATCEITYFTTGDCSGIAWTFEHSPTGAAPWTVLNSGTGNIPNTVHSVTLNGFYRVVTQPGGNGCVLNVAGPVPVNCVVIPSCDCSATLALNPVTCILNLDIFGVDCPGRPWQLQYSASGTGWTAVATGVGNVSTTHTPTANGIYRLIVTDPGGTCTPIQTPNVVVNCLGADLCSVGGINQTSGTLTGYSQTFSPQPVGTTIFWEFSSGAIPQTQIPDAFIMTVGSTQVVNTGAITNGSSCFGFSGCSQPLITLADFLPPGQPAGSLSLTGIIPVDVDGNATTPHQGTSTASCGANTNEIFLVDTMIIGGSTYYVTAKGSYTIKPADAGQSITIDVIADPCSAAGSNFWGLKLICT